MRRLKLFFACLLMAVLSIGQVWGAETYSVTFNTASSDGSTCNTTVSNYVTETTYITSMTADKAYYNGKSGMKLGSSSSVGNAVFTLTDAGKVKASNISVVSAAYDSDKTYKCTITYTDNTTVQQSQTFGSNLSCDLDNTKTISKIKFESVTSSKGRGYISSFTITYSAGGGDTPTPSLEQVTVSGTPSTTTYEAGNAFDITGLTVTGSYDVGDDAAITEGITWEARTSAVADDAAALNAYTLTAGQTALQVRATVSEIASSWFDVTGLTVNEHVVTPGTYNVTLNNALFGSEATGSLSGDALHDYTGQQNDITFNYVKGSGSNMYMNASQIRLYKNITLVVSVPAGFYITEVTGLVANIAANVGSISNNIWTGKSNSITFSFTASSGNAQLGAISVTYEAVAPEVTVDPASLSFTAKQNIAVEGKTFTLEGANLTSGLTLAASTGFSVSPTSLTAEAAMVEGGVEVTVTPATPTATTTPVEGTVTISGGGLSESVEVALSMAVTPTYAVAVAVNDGNMGSATINNGAGPVYAEYAEDVTLVATPESGYEFVSWSASDDDIEIADATSATTTATIGAAGTITATFQAQACTNLAAPVLDEITKTYQSATIAWNAVTNAEGYVLNIVKHEGSVAVLTDEIIVAPAVSFEKTGLDANTQYDYTVMAVGDGTSYCDESNPTLAGSFTTSDYPAATLSLVENGGTPYNWGSDLKLNSVIALPEELDGLGCTGKVLVGWTNDKDFADTDDDPTGEDYYWAKGADYTIASTADKLYAVLADEEDGTPAIWQLTSSDITKDGTGSGYAPYNCDRTKSGITFTTSDVMVGTGDNANKIQLKANAGIIYNKTAFDADIVSIVVTDVNVGVFEGESEISSTPSSGAISATGSGPYTYTFSSGKRYFHLKKNTSNAGYVTSITVNLKGESSYSGYTTECTAQLPVLDAPEFSLAAGSYYDALQTVTLTATNEADIYYTLDGTDPTNASTLYSAPIALNARGEYTIKAIAIKTGFESSEIATRAYSIVLPYDFADFVELTKENGKEYAVRGIISQKDVQLYSGKLPYWISADGQTAGQIKCHNGLKENKANFESVDDVNLGDNVTVVGTWSTQYSNLNAGNWMLEYTPRVHASYTIEGELTASSFDDGDAFDDAILANLTVKETFTNGYYENMASGVTFNAGEKTAWADGDTKLTVNAVLNEAIIATKDFDVTVSSAQLASIALKADDENYSTKVEYYLGDAFVAPTIVATLDDASSYEAVATYVSGFDNANAGVQEVTVSYTRGAVTETTSYNITMKPIFNTLATAYDVTEAKYIIENVYASTTESTDSMFVSGMVVNNPNSDGTYYISVDGTSANQLQVYKGKYFSKTVSAKDNIKAGDEVTIRGLVQVYSNAAELKYAVVMSQLRAGALTIADVTEFEVGADDLEAGDLTITTASNGAITFVSGDETIVSIEEGKLHAVAAGTATITANLAATANKGAINYTAASTTFDVTVIAAQTKYTITFDGNGADGGEAPEDIADQVENAEVTLPANAWTKDGYKFDGWKVINISTSAEITVTAGKFSMPASAVTIQAQWAEIPSWAYVYDNNVVVAHTGSGTDDGTITINETEYKLVKAGAGSNTGTIKVTVPAGATDLHFHAFAWGGKTAKIQIAGVKNASISEFDLAGEAGAAGSGNDFTLQGVPVDQYYHVSFDAVADETEIVFSKATGSADNRFFFYGVNQEGGDFGSYQRSTTSGNYGTICLPYAGTISGATLLDIAYFDGAMIYCDEVNGVALKAGKPYIFYATSNSLNVAYTANIATAAGEANGLHGFYNLENMATDEAAQKNLTQDDGNYILYNNQYWLVSGRAAYINNFRAYIKLGEISTTAPTPNPSQAPRRRVAMNVNGEQVATGFENLNASEKPVKLMIDGNIYILRGEKLYDATGRLVK